ncbi:endoglucanase [Bacillaceae bacterium JMAK1]|nr:endoglucanase [Bacillaceae bacterium JMAK1]
MSYNHQFLYELVNTPSPSGYEELVQSKWLNYVQSFADELRTDNAGNAYAILNPNAPFKVLIAGHADEIGFLVKSIDEQGFIYVEKLGGISPANALGMEVTIHGEDGEVTGTFGTNAEHHGGAKDKITVDDLYIDIGATSKEEAKKYARVGDTATYHVTPKTLLNQRVSARGLDNRSGAYIVAEVIRRLQGEKVQVGVYGVSTVNEETNMGGAYFAGAQVEPTMAIALDVTFATDYPSADPKKNGDVQLGKGPVLAIGAPINRKINALFERVASENGIGLQYELTPRTTGTDADRLRVTGRGVPVAVVSLPLRYMHAPREVVSLEDIELEIELLVRFILSLEGKEGLKPIEVPSN